MGIQSNWNAIFFCIISLWKFEVVCVLCSIILQFYQNVYGKTILFHTIYH
jgi:hypothetical protein